MRLKYWALFLGLLAVLAACGCVGEKKENIQTVTLYGPTEDRDCNLSVNLPDGFYIDKSAKPFASNGIMMSGIKILNKNLTGVMGVILLNMNEPKRSMFMLNDLSDFVNKSVNYHSQYLSSVDGKFIGRDGRAWHFFERIGADLNEQDIWFFGVPMDDKAAILISSSYPKNVTDEFLNNMQIKSVIKNK